MLNQYLILFGSAILIGTLAVGYALFCRTARSRRFFVAVFVTVCVLWLDCDWGMGLLSQFNIRNYPSTNGKILYQEVSKLGIGWRSAAHVDVTYQYSINGQTYTGNRIRLIDGSCGFSGTSMAAWGHTIGSQVLVYYDPANPQRAYLSVGLNSIDDSLTLAILLGANILAAYTWIRAWYRGSKEDGD